jgi:hypothetical protein
MLSALEKGVKGMCSRDDVEVMASHFPSYASCSRELV